MEMASRVILGCFGCLDKETRPSRIGSAVAAIGLRVRREVPLQSAVSHGIFGVQKVISDVTEE
jgi:hypothetical protein